MTTTTVPSGDNSLLKEALPERKISRLEIYKAFYTLLRLRTSALPWQ